MRCNHSYVRTNETLFIWRQSYGGCLELSLGYAYKKVNRPHRIDEIINEKCKGDLVDVCLQIKSCFVITNHISICNCIRDIQAVNIIFESPGSCLLNSSPKYCKLSGSSFKCWGAH